nr:MAG TPA: hypothetical protein [Caudoviricetes sp.]DAQ69167.1 MAG TPA: hypothetical protein [Caudoviricetes sp.]
MFIHRQNLLNKSIFDVTLISTRLVVTYMFTFTINISMFRIANYTFR